MSNALCEIWTRDTPPALVGYTSYQGSTDVISPGIVDDIEAAWDTGGWDRECAHGIPLDAWAYSWYGGGDHWPVTVCTECRVVKGPLSPYEPDWGYAPIGMSAERRAKWEVERRWWREFSAAGWPKDGPPPGVVDCDERSEDG